MSASPALDIRPTWPRWRRRKTLALLLPLALALLIASPLLSVALRSLAPLNSAADAFVITNLLRMSIYNSLMLVGGTLVATLLLGTITAWLITLYDFPGRRFLAWLLVLPLAMPCYVIAIAYADLFHVAGPISQGFMSLGLSPVNLPLQSRGGAIAVYALAFYPYVYAVARTAFLEQSVCLLEAGRVHGCTPWVGFFSVVLRAARPAIVAGLALVMMETLTDYGVVAILGIETFTTSIMKSWTTYGDVAMACRLSLALAGLTALALLLERCARARAGFWQLNSRCYRGDPPYLLKGSKALGACLLCLLPPLFGFALPLGHLLSLAATPAHWPPGLLTLAWHSFQLASGTAVIALAGALTLVYATRLNPGALQRLCRSIAGWGYILPGPVIAIGMLGPMLAFDHWFAGRQNISTPILTGSLLALVFAYLVRFLAAAMAGIDSSFGRIDRSIDDAARSLGRRPLSMLASVHLPIIHPGLLIAALLVFVEVLKELPVTLLLRPFDYDTLAVKLFHYASDERLAEAAVVSACLVLLAAPAVLIICRWIAGARHLNRENGCTTRA